MLEIIFKMYKNPFDAGSNYFTIQSNDIKLNAAAWLRMSDDVGLLVSLILRELKIIGPLKESNVCCYILFFCFLRFDTDGVLDDFDALIMMLKIGD